MTSPLLRVVRQKKLKQLKARYFPQALVETKTELKLSKCFHISHTKEGSSVEVTQFGSWIHLHDENRKTERASFDFICY